MKAIQKIENEKLKKKNSCEKLEKSLLRGAPGYTEMLLTVINVYLSYLAYLARLKKRTEKLANAFYVSLVPLYEFGTIKKYDL